MPDSTSTSQKATGEDTGEALFTLEVSMKKTRQPGRIDQEDEVHLKSFNLSNDEVKQMRQDFAPALIKQNTEDVP